MLLKFLLTLLSKINSLNSKEQMYNLFSNRHLFKIKNDFFM